ncbi:hypothetical protein EJB05_12622, partial [Eragrostis curvula]
MEIMVRCAVAVGEPAMEVMRYLSEPSSAMEEAYNFLLIRLGRTITNKRQHIIMVSYLTISLVWAGDAVMFFGFALVRHIDKVFGGLQTFKQHA